MNMGEKNYQKDNNMEGLTGEEYSITQIPYRDVK